MKIVSLILLILLSSSCASTVIANRAKISKGMTKGEVIDLLGIPDLINSIGPSEGLFYESGYGRGFEKSHGSFCVMIEGGIVVAYGNNNRYWCGR